MLPAPPTPPRPDRVRAAVGRGPGESYPARTVRRAPVLVIALLACALLGSPALAQEKRVPASAADVGRAWVRDWTRGEETAVCSVVAQPLLVDMALASGTSACSGAVGSALRAATGRWGGASIVTQRAELVDGTLARVTFTLRHTLAGGGPVLPDRIFLTRPDGRTGKPWRVASLGLLPFVASGASDLAIDPSTLDPPGDPRRLREPIRPGRLRPACSGEAVTVEDAAGDVRAQAPPPRAAGQLLPEHPRGQRFGTIRASRPFVFTGARRRTMQSLDIRDLTMFREADGQVCLEVRFAEAPRPDSRLLVRWFEPIPGSNTEGTAGAVEVRFDGRAGRHFWFDRARTTVTDPDFATRYRPRVPRIGRSGNVLSIRLSAQDMSNPERFRIALQSASTSTSDPGAVAHVSAGDTMGRQASGFDWPSGLAAPIFDASGVN
ncbi:MAG: hypothetical protein QOG77_3282 [Solirubrobacteraceae bacterium]|nr:hypothetical protein [Solirubrobacteraceae bacterium]